MIETIKKYAKELLFKYRSLSYVQKSNINTFIISLFSLLWLAAKFFLAVYYKSIIFISSSSFSAVVLFAKAVYLDSLLRGKVSEKNKLKYYGIMNFCVYLSSSSYIAYWGYAMGNPNVLSFPLSQVIWFVSVSLIESISAIYGIYRERKERDFLLQGLKCINLSTAIGSTSVAIISLCSYEKFFGFLSNYAIAYWTVFVGFYMSFNLARNIKMYKRMKLLAFTRLNREELV